MDPAGALELVEGDGQRFGELDPLLETGNLRRVVGVVGFVEHVAERGGQSVRRGGRRVPVHKADEG